MCFQTAFLLRLIPRNYIVKCRIYGNKAERPSERPPLPAKHNLSDGLSVETGLMVIQIQIRLIFDAVPLVLNRDIQFLIAAFEFQIGIVVFDFRFDKLETAYIRFVITVQAIGINNTIRHDFLFRH